MGGILHSSSQRDGKATATPGWGCWQPLSKSGVPGTDPDVRVGDTPPPGPLPSPSSGWMCPLLSPREGVQLPRGPVTDAGGISRTQPRPNPTSRGVGCQPLRSSGGRSIPLPSLPQHSQGENQREQRRERLRVTLRASRSRRGQRDPHPWVTRPWHTSLSPTGAGTGQGGGRSKPCTPPPAPISCVHTGRAAPATSLFYPPKPREQPVVAQGRQPLELF